MLKQANTVDIDKSAYTLASAVKAMNADEDLREINTTGIDLQHQVMQSPHKAIYAEDLPKMDFVAPSIKKQILEGKDVNLTILLSSKYDLPQQHTMQSGGLTIELNTKKDVRLEHNLSLEEFNRAFRKYRSYHVQSLSTQKGRIRADINEITHNYGPCFYTYHKMFSAKAIVNYSAILATLTNNYTRMAE